MPWSFCGIWSKNGVHITDTYAGKGGLEHFASVCKMPPHCCFPLLMLPYPTPCRFRVPSPPHGLPPMPSTTTTAPLPVAAPMLLPQQSSSSEGAALMVRARALLRQWWWRQGQSCRRGGSSAIVRERMGRGVGWICRLR